jgi:hypothetical protein
MDISIPYYEDNSRVSNSAIGWFIKRGPRYFRDMLDGKEEGMNFSFLEKGTMIHEYLLQPDEFWKDYIILDFATPKVKQQKDLLDEYHRLMQVNPLESQDKLKLSAYKKAYSNKKSDEKCIEEAEGLIMIYQDYLEYLSKKDDNKKIISFADLQMLKKIKENIQNHKKANELLFNYPETFEVHNEFHINWEYPNASSLGDLPCKSLLDRVMIDHTNKKIILVDIKTTADVYNFKHSVEEFDYCRQLAYYWLAIHWYFKNELKLNIEEYEYETYIIAVQSHDGYEVRVFKFNPKTVEERLVAIDYAIKRIAWHKDNNLWDHMKEYYDEDGAEMIC